MAPRPPSQVPDHFHGTWCIDRLTVNAYKPALHAEASLAGASEERVLALAKQKTAQISAILSCPRKPLCKTTLVVRMFWPDVRAVLSGSATHLPMLVAGEYNNGLDGRVPACTFHFNVATPQGGYASSQHFNIPTFRVVRRLRSPSLLRLPSLKGCSAWGGGGRRACWVGGDSRAGQRAIHAEALHKQASVGTAPGSTALHFHSELRATDLVRGARIAASSLTGGQPPLHTTASRNTATKRDSRAKGLATCRGMPIEVRGRSWLSLHPRGVIDRGWVRGPAECSG